mmetsp:Transcript_81295/g.159596  ORF Transcript_81295/g.159596 Transcript_81295/m.159596 type:complete len:227 (+) Transcript_81295:204-884(+)
MGMVSRCGLMVPCTTASGNWTKRRERANLFTWMVMFTRAIGSATRPTVTASTTMPTDRGMRVIGWMTSNMAMALKFGRTVRDTRVRTSWAAKAARAVSLGQMVPSTKANSRTTTSAARVPTSGAMGGCSEALGQKIACMVEVFSHGWTAVRTKVITNSTKKMATESSSGQTVVCMRGSGRRASSTAKGVTQLPMGSSGKANGQRGKECAGLQTKLKPMRTARRKNS